MSMSLRDAKRSYERSWKRYMRDMSAGKDRYGFPCGKRGDRLVAICAERVRRGLPVPRYWDEVWTTTDANGLKYLEETGDMAFV